MSCLRGRPIDVYSSLVRTLAVDAVRCSLLTLSRLHYAAFDSTEFDRGHFYMTFIYPSACGHELLVQEIQIWSIHNSLVEAVQSDGLTMS